MPTRVVSTFLLVSMIGLSIPLALAESRFPPKSRSLSRKVLEDKIRGGWAGQMFGVSYGAPVEFKSLGKIFESEIKWSPEMVSNSIYQDDLYVEITFIEVMDRIGLNATSEQYGEAFKNSQYNLWHANAGARRLLLQGIKPPWSGHPKYNLHSNDIDFQIESDFIGMMTPGLPQEANKYADRVGHVMNFGDGVYGGMLFAGMYSAAFFEDDPRKVVELGLQNLPKKSGYRMIIQDTLDWSKQYPNDWKKTWALLEEKWDKDDIDADGSLRPFNIDARLNGAYVVLGLLYGNGDFDKTIEISTRAGQDADCNPSSAAGILGVIKGYEATPDKWKSGISAIADKKFDYTNYSFNSITDSTVKRALKVIEMAGGKVTDTEVIIPIQKPKPAKLEQFDPGVPDKIIDTNDTAWQWNGAWPAEKFGKTANGSGAEALFKFNGVGCMIVGELTQQGGRADVFVDGKKAAQIDAYIPERTHDNAMWHIFGLKNGEHTVKIVMRDDADARSKGKKVMIDRVVIYRAR